MKNEHSVRQVVFRNGDTKTPTVCFVLSQRWAVYGTGVNGSGNPGVNSGSHSFSALIMSLFIEFVPLAWNYSRMRVCLPASFEMRLVTWFTCEQRGIHSVCNRMKIVQLTDVGFIGFVQGMFCWEPQDSRSKQSYSFIGWGSKRHTVLCPT